MTIQRGHTENSVTAQENVFLLKLYVPKVRDFDIARKKFWNDQCYLQAFSACLSMIFEGKVLSTFI